jgi:hypothetical protein
MLLVCQDGLNVYLGSLVVLVEVLHGVLHAGDDTALHVHHPGGVLAVRTDGVHMAILRGKNNR